MLSACLCPHSYKCSRRQLRIDQCSESHSRRIINLNLDFPLFLTRAFLPQLRRVSQSTGPVEVVFIGSLAGESSIPFLCTYSASKSFLKRAAFILREDERALHGPNLSFMYLNVAQVRSSTLTGDPSLAKPLADEFAKSVVGSLGCGRRVVVPWYFHHFLTGIMSLFPESLCEYFARAGARGVMKNVDRPKDQ